MITSRQPWSGATREWGGPLAALAFFLLFTSCSKPFDVNVKAPEPIKVDVNMDVHVYQHGTPAGAKKTSPEKVADADADRYKGVLERRRNRMAEVQTLKNNSYVGENHLGLLELRALPNGEHGEWVKKTLKDENEDRSFLMEYESETKAKSLKEVQAEQRLHLQRKSHPGEWLEVDDPDRPGNYLWIQKKSPLGSTDASPGKTPEAIAKPPAP